MVKNTKFTIKPMAHFAYELKQQWEYFEHPAYFIWRKMIPATQDQKQLLTLGQKQKHNNNLLILKNKIKNIFFNPVNTVQWHCPCIFILPNATRMKNAKNEYASSKKPKVAALGFLFSP